MTISAPLLRCRLAKPLHLPKRARAFGCAFVTVTRAATAATKIEADLPRLVLLGAC